MWCAPDDNLNRTDDPYNRFRLSDEKLQKVLETMRSFRDTNLEDMIGKREEFPVTNLKLDMVKAVASILIEEGVDERCFSDGEVVS